MRLQSFIEEPLLWISFLILLAGFVVRITVFSISIINRCQNKDSKWRYVLGTFVRSFIPFHMGFIKKPLYSLLRAIFHIFMFIVPVWLSSHIVLWSDSRFEWEWISIPDVWADWMTIIILALALYFIIRRLIITELRIRSTPLDYFLVIITGLPFLTGYLLMHGTLDNVYFLGDNMYILHILSAEIMMIMSVFLFTKILIAPGLCTGCMACVLACPTGTLESKDDENYRSIRYSHYQCIVCAACVDTCPENAVVMRHIISFSSFVNWFKKHEVRNVALQECKSCGAFFAPEPLIHKIEDLIKDGGFDECTNCRRNNLGRLLSTCSSIAKSRAFNSKPS